VFLPKSNAVAVKRLRTCKEYKIKGRVKKITNIWRTSPNPRPVQPYVYIKLSAHYNAKALSLYMLYCI
jgi:hypothetical protein